MIEDIDLWRAAKLMVDRCGHEAELQAASRADEKLESGDMEGRAVWLRIASAIRELQRGRMPDEPVN